MVFVSHSVQVGNDADVPRAQINFTNHNTVADAPLPEGIFPCKWVETHREYWESTGYHQTRIEEEVVGLDTGVPDVECEMFIVLP